MVMGADGLGLQGLSASIIYLLSSADAACKSGAP